MLLPNGAAELVPKAVEVPPNGLGAALEPKGLDVLPVEPPKGEGAAPPNGVEAAMVPESPPKGEGADLKGSVAADGAPNGVEVDPKGVEVLPKGVEVEPVFPNGLAVCALLLSPNGEGVEEGKEEDAEGKGEGVAEGKGEGVAEGKGEAVDELPKGEG